ncbi:flagellar hook-basal body complex protein FliE [Anaerobiospirillum succiniciproducens]
MNSGVVNNNNADKVYQPAYSAGQTVGEFKQLLKDAFENVNIIQNESASMAQRFDVGDRSVTLADVMIASNKSSLSFEATLQVRNKLVDAYQTIMQMQI